MTTTPRRFTMTDRARAEKWHPTPAMARVLDDPAASYWLKWAVYDLLQRDAVDAHADAECLATLMGERVTNLFAGASVWDSVRDSVRASVRDSVRVSDRDNVRGSPPCPHNRGRAEDGGCTICGEPIMI